MRSCLRCWRWGRWLALSLTLVVAGCGSETTVTATSTTTTTATTTTKPLPYDAEENAFMGQFSWSNGTDTSTGCLARIDSQAACDCAYRALRADGYPASQLAAVASGIAIENNLPDHTPSWMATEITRCELNPQ